MSTSLQRAYRAVLTRLVDLDDDSGAPVTVDHLKSIAALTREEKAAVCEHHAQAIRDELQLDPAMLAAFERGDISPLDLVSHVREATENACWQAIGLDLLGELQDRAENAAEAAYEREQGECFRGNEYASYLATQQDEARRLK